MMTVLKRCAAVVVLGLAGCVTMPAEPEATGTDGETRDLIEERLATDSVTRSKMYAVDVQGTQARVRGTVRSEAERMRVLGVVRGTPGIESVVDQLRVAP
jgi:osmotically-inducible protein OsmY